MNRDERIREAQSDVNKTSSMEFSCTNALSALVANACKVTPAFRAILRQALDALDSAAMAHARSQVRLQEAVQGKGGQGRGAEVDRGPGGDGHGSCATPRPDTPYRY